MSATENGPPSPSQSPSPSRMVTQSEVENARLEADLAEEDARKAEAFARKANANAATQLAVERAEVRVQKIRQVPANSKFMRALRGIAMAAGIAFAGAGVVDDYNNWLHYADGTAVSFLGAGSLVGAALSGDKKKKTEDDDDEE